VHLIRKRELQRELDGGVALWRSEGPVELSALKRRVRCNSTVVHTSVHFS